MSRRASPNLVARFIVGLSAAAMIGAAPCAQAATSATSAISEDVSAAIAQMGKSLLAEQYSFQARTLRVYVDRSGQMLHIAHTLKVLVRRPDRLAIDVTGDDVSSKLFYDGRTVTVFGVESKKYATVPAPGTIQAMLDTLIGKLHIDFPLADFLSNTPDKSFLSGVTSGREINTVTIDGVPCRHLLLAQAPKIELELWVEKNDKALPRRLIVTYRAEPGEPSFVAELSDWNFSIHPTDADFTFQPPDGATKVELKPAAAAASAKPPGTKP
jgi:hypothetical protein